MSAVSRSETVPSPTRQAPLAHEDGFRKLRTVEWVPVPDEGWEIEAASAGNPAVRLLNGQWDFAIRERHPEEAWYRIRDKSWWAWDKKRNALVEVDGPQRRHPFDREFAKPDGGGIEWSPISVPANWEGQAFSQHVFAHMSLDRDDKVGYYRRRFGIPGEWSKPGRVILQSEGVAASAEVYVNGTRVGYHDGGFIPFQMDITDAVRSDGPNTIAIRVVKGDVSTVHDNSGQWMTSGIWRDIFVFHVPDAHVTDLHVDSDYDPEKKEGRLALSLRGSAAAADCEVEAVLLPWEEDEPIATVRAGAANDSVDTPSWSLQIATRDIEAWNPEVPTMYRIECRLIRGGDVIERVREEVGFRRFSAEGEQFLLNGEPFLIRGVTRHEIKQGVGRSLSVGDMLNEIRLMRDANINGVRSHPYPFDPRWIKLCARHGILVCSGYCLCGYNSWGNPWALSEVKTYPTHEAEIDPGYRELFQDRYHYFAPRIYGRLKNMTAVFAWSLSNESAISEIFVPVARFLRDREQRRRFILSAGDVCMNKAGFDDRHPEQKQVIEHVRWECITADSQHYPERYTAEKLPSTVPWDKNRPRPMFYTESAHPFCNRDNFMLDPAMLGDLYGRGLKRTFDTVRTMPGAGGYFVFEWCDQSVMQKGDPALSDSFIKPWHGYTTYNQNLKGLLGPNHEPKPSYHSVRKAFARVQIEPVAVEDGTLKVRIQNDYTFANLDRLVFTATPMGEAGPVGGARTFPVSAAPGESVEVALPLTEDSRAGAARETEPETAALDIAVYDPAWPGPVAERRISLREAPAAESAVRLQAVQPLVQDGVLNGIRFGDKELPFGAPVSLSLGTAEAVGQQRYTGMGHISTNDTPKNFITGADVERREIVRGEETDAPGLTWSEVHHLSGDRGRIVGRFEISTADDGSRLRIRQRIEREGAPVWLSGLGLAFSLPTGYREIDWRRHGGVWTEYPAGHPDRLRGHELLNVNEYPPVNPFRHPSFTALLPVRNADFVTLTGERVPSLWIHAPNEGQRVTARSLPDHRLQILLLADAYCSHPYHEFSFHRNDDARRSLLGLRQLRDGNPVELEWEIGAGTSE